MDEALMPCPPCRPRRNGILARVHPERTEAVMSRSLPEWIGKTDDTPVPDRVRVRVFDAKGGLCHMCTRKIRAGEKWTCEHIIALINWRKTDEQPHGNRESNLGLTCCNCLAPKNAADQAEKSEIYDKRRKHILPHGIKKSGRGFYKPARAKFNWQSGRYER